MPKEPIATVLADVREGQLVADIDEAVARAVEAARETNKVATVKVTIKVKPKSANQIIIRDDVKTTLPEPERPDTTLFVDENNKLSRRDPRQPRLLDQVATVTPITARGEG